MPTIGPSYGQSDLAPRRIVGIGRKPFRVDAVENDFDFVRRTCRIGSSSSAQSARDRMNAFASAVEDPPLPQGIWCALRLRKAMFAMQYRSGPSHRSRERRIYKGPKLCVCTTSGLILEITLRRAKTVRKEKPGLFIENVNILRFGQSFHKAPHVPNKQHEFRTVSDPIRERR